MVRPFGLDDALAQVAQVVLAQAQIAFDFPPFFIIFVAAVLLFLLIATASQHRRYSSQTQNKLCRGCGASHPGYAAFCRRCGRKL